MKKLFAIFLAVAMLASMATFVSAAETTTSGSITVKAAVPSAKYILNIPEDMQSVPYGEQRYFIGNVTVAGGENFAKGKNLNVAVIFDGLFKSDSVSTTIPFEVWCSHFTSYPDSSAYSPVKMQSGDALVFYGNEDTSVDEKATVTFPYNGYDSSTKKDTVESLYIKIANEAWGKAMAGEYTTIFTFSAEIVAEN